MKKRHPALIALLALFAAAPGMAAPINIDFSALTDPMSIVGTPVQVGEVEFYYDDFGAGDAVDVSAGGVLGMAPEGAEGVAGILSLSFLAGPSDGLAFDFMLPVLGEPEDFDLYLLLFGGEGGDPDPIEIEGIFDPDAGAVVGRFEDFSLASFTFANVLFSEHAPLFLIDNLSYQPAAGAPVPEPGSMLLLGAGLVLVARFARRRR